MAPTSTWRLSRAASGAHELEVVDHDALDAVLGDQAAGPGAEPEHRQAGRVVDEDPGFGELVHRLAQAVVILIAQAAGRMSCELKPERALSRRCAIEALDISRLKNATGTGLKFSFRRSWACAAHGDLLGEVEREGGVAHAHILCDEVVRVGHRQVVHLLRSERLDGNDAIPVDVTGSEIREMLIAERRRDPGGGPGRAIASRRAGCLPRADRFREAAPRSLTLGRGDTTPHAHGNQVAVGLVAALVEGVRNAIDSLFLAEDADLADERPDRVGVGDIELPRHAPGLAVLDEPLPQRRDHAESQQQVLNLPGQTLADGGVAELSLATGKHGGPSIGAEEPVEEQRQQIAAKREHGRGNGLVMGALAHEPKRSEPDRERVGVVAADPFEPAGSQIVGPHFEHRAQAGKGLGIGCDEPLRPMRDGSGGDADRSAIDRDVRPERPMASRSAPANSARCSVREVSSPTTRHEGASQSRVDDKLTRKPPNSSTAWRTPRRCGCCRW